MTTNETTNEAREAAIRDATTDKLEDVSPPMSPDPETQDGPVYRADVGVGRWMPPSSAWKINDHIFLRLRDGKTAGPFYVISCHAPRDRTEKWRYDIRDGSGKVKTNISGSIMV